MVQVALAKESVLWKRGWYTFPPVRIPSHWLGNCTIYPVGRVHTPSYRATYLTVHDCLVLLHQYKVCLQSVPRTLKEMQDLQTRLAALDVVIRQVTPAPDHAPHYTSIGRACHLQQALGGSRRCSKPKAFSLPLQPPTITGRYSSATFSFFMEPAQGEFRAVMAAFKAMTATAGRALRGSGCGQYGQLQEDITALEESRCAPVPSQTALLVHDRHCQPGAASSSCSQCWQLQADIAALEESRCTLFLCLADSHFFPMGVSDGLAHIALAVGRGLHCSGRQQVRA